MDTSKAEKRINWRMPNCREREYKKKINCSEGKYWENCGRS
jgi:hypothetical protein